MNDQRLAQLLRHADASDSAIALRNSATIATTARAIRQRRQQRSRVITAAFSMLVVGGSVASMISWRNAPHTRSSPINQSVALREQVDRLDSEIERRMDAIHAMSRPKSSAAKQTKLKSPARDVGIELDVQRERAAAIILQAADQLREAGRSDFANDRYHDLISLFPDTAAAQLARERMEQMKNRT
jgi:TolA-binding protein